MLTRLPELRPFCPVCGVLLESDSYIYEEDNGYLPGEILGCEKCFDETDYIEEEIFRTTAWEREQIWN